ncbi:gluconate 2-dehydrogenase subunit 3 family protein [Halonotius terrestris]|uniref:Gluconate 2-dehydrogenase subunit 3 family protein n=1 Tax=Halonotius terrestris TaxID=2487750 RepID=A0A8J8PCW9_9EURY|nr:gluconate 2-dehydrogenase subunit 3 family protein [Halonotius terrestris]TQQ81239.1 gluconate 2-dehydrogenase subunit 3 family protein [Halonotius terrestris]
MELTRRDAVSALTALGASVAVAGCSDAAPTAQQPDRDADVDADVDADTELRETMVAAAEVVYPDEVTGIDTFVNTFLDSRLAGDRHAASVADAVAAVNDRAKSWYDDRFAALDADTRDSVLREMGADTAEPHRDGSTAEEVRYYVVNELLLALYSSPTGGELVGIENPQGHAGGTDSYQRGPPT